VHFYQYPNTGSSPSTPSTTDGMYAQTIPLYYCPSDRPGALWKGDVYWRARGNYCVNWGNMTVPYNPADPVQDPGKGIAPFGYLNFTSYTKPTNRRLLHITDGTSNTMLMSEIIMANQDTDYDIRGDMMNDDRPCTMYMTLNTPNSGTDVSPYCNGTTYPGNPPCTNTGSGFAHKTARSRHSGGVNILMADGAVRFVVNSINVTTWRAVGTMNGQEVLGDY
jgi:prepilin-type processing-associated H-X9-DG protein